MCECVSQTIPILFLVTRYPTLNWVSQTLTPPKDMATSNATFITVDEFKTLHGISKLILCFDPEKDTHSIRLEGTRSYFRVDGKLITADHKLDRTCDMAIRIEEDGDAANLDDCCLVKVKPSTLEETDEL